MNGKIGLQVFFDQVKGGKATGKLHKRLKVMVMCWKQSSWGQHLNYQHVSAWQRKLYLAILSETPICTQVVSDKVPLKWITKRIKVQPHRGGEKSIGVSRVGLWSGYPSLSRLPSLPQDILTDHSIPTSEMANHGDNLRLLTWKLFQLNLFSDVLVTQSKDRDFDERPNNQTAFLSLCPLQRRCLVAQHLRRDQRRAICSRYFRLAHRLPPWLTLLFQIPPWRMLLFQIITMVGVGLHQVRGTSLQFLVNFDLWATRYEQGQDRWSAADKVWVWEIWAEKVQGSLSQVWHQL